MIRDEVETYSEPEEKEEKEEEEKVEEPKVELAKDETPKEDNVAASPGGPDAQAETIEDGVSSEGSDELVTEGKD